MRPCWMSEKWRWGLILKCQLSCCSAGFHVNFQTRDKWRYNWRLCSHRGTTAASLNRLAVCRRLLWWCTLLGSVCEGVFSVCQLPILESNSCCWVLSVYLFSFWCISLCYLFAWRPMSFSISVCVSLCVCPLCAASKPWHVALTGLSSINGSALGLKLGGRRKKGWWTHTQFKILLTARE